MPVVGLLPCRARSRSLGVPSLVGSTSLIWLHVIKRRAISVCLSTLFVIGVTSTAGCRDDGAGLAVSGDFSVSTTTTTTTAAPVSTTTTTTTAAPRLRLVRSQPAVKPNEVDRPVVVPTLRSLIRSYFKLEDREWAERVAFCESSAEPDDVFSFAVNSSSRASGWFQHLPKFWEERTEAIGLSGVSIADPEAQVRVAAYLLYETAQGRSHWEESKGCWDS